MPHEVLELAVSLDAFGDHTKAEPPGDREDDLSDDGVVRLQEEVPDKRVVDLDDVDGEASQVIE